MNCLINTLRLDAKKCKINVGGLFIQILHLLFYLSAPFHPQHFYNSQLFPVNKQSLLTGFPDHNSC